MKKLFKEKKYTVSHKNLLVSITIVVSAILFCLFIVVAKNFYLNRTMKDSNSNKTEFVLIVDDNDKYAKALENYFQSLKIPADRARDAKEGYQMFQEKTYSAVITDITMETQTSGLWLARRIYKEGYNGKIIIASTGFDVWGVMGLGRYFLPWFAGVGWMIPKVPLKQGRVEFHPTYIQKETEPFRKNL